MIKTVTVLLDTNALLMPHQHGIDVFSEISRIVSEKYYLATLSTVVDELESISSSRAKDDGVAAEVGLKLLREKGVSIIPSEGPVDDALAEYASRWGALVCTNDRYLKAKLKAKGVRVISMRGKTHLEVG